MTPNPLHPSTPSFESPANKDPLPFTNQSSNSHENRFDCLHFHLRERLQRTLYLQKSPRDKKGTFWIDVKHKKTSLHSSVARRPKRPHIVVPGRPPLATAVVFNTHRHQQSRTIFCQEKTQFGRKLNALWNIGAYFVCCRTLSLIPVSKIIVVALHPTNIWTSFSYDVRAHSNSFSIRGKYDELNFPLSSSGRLTDLKL